MHFPVTTEDEYTQAMFDQGLGQLHGFWYFESERSFRQVAALDPDCAAAYWGMAMANVDNEERAAGFARDAWLRRENATEREQHYIDSLARFYDVDYAEPEEGEDDEHERDTGDDHDRGHEKMHDETALPADPQVDAAGCVDEFSFPAMRRATRHRTVIGI